MHEQEDRIAEWTVLELIERIRRPRYRCGGGVAACLTLAQAAALGDLVRRAAHRHLEQSQTHELAIGLASVIEQALARADLDRAVLHDLLSTFQPTIPTGDRESVVERATMVPLQTADLALQLLETLNRLAPSVPPFAASDLVAARALARASVEAALAMAQANLSLLPPHRAAAFADGIQRRLVQLRSILE
ncbi:MAG: cyclodeaminase/cyclohydrolase family protein [Thermomicrobium sp.]|nr:cyclodeaminase/cyclohydrolase family protein [Thermomicrobium sp.]MDW7981701.1 cyclodeaminase/cyclohydrolase family protein [Thermomicrobium sp.]